MTFGRTNFKPAQQGQLDGFCGVYSLLNFFCRHRNCEPESEDGKKIFRRLLVLLDRQGKLTVERICTGFREGQLQKAFNVLAGELHVPYKAWRLASVAGKRNVQDILELIAGLHVGEAAMVHMDECDHWVLAHSGSAKEFWIDDSSEEVKPCRARAPMIRERAMALDTGLVFLNAQTH